MLVTVIFIIVISSSCWNIIISADLTQHQAKYTIEERPIEGNELRKFFLMSYRTWNNLGCWESNVYNVWEGLYSDWHLFTTYNNNKKFVTYEEKVWKDK